MNNRVFLCSQAAAGEVPYVSAGPAVREATLPDPFQRAGSGGQSDGVLGGGLLLSPAASHRNRHAGGQVLHQEGGLFSRSVTNLT